MLKSLRPKEWFYCLIFLINVTALPMMNPLAEHFYRVLTLNVKSIYEQRMGKGIRILSTSQKAIQFPDEHFASLSRKVSQIENNNIFDGSSPYLSLLTLNNGHYRLRTEEELYPGLSAGDDLIVINEETRNVLSFVYDGSDSVFRQEYLRDLTAKADKFYVFSDESCPPSYPELIKLIESFAKAYDIGSAERIEEELPNLKQGLPNLEFSHEPLLEFHRKVMLLFWFAIYNIHLGNTERALEIVNFMNKLDVCREETPYDYTEEAAVKNLASVVLRKIPSVPAGTYQRLARISLFSRNKLVTTVATDALLKYFLKDFSNRDLHEPPRCIAGLFCLPSRNVHPRFIAWIQLEQEMEIVEKIEKGFCKPILQSVSHRGSILQSVSFPLLGFNVGELPTTYSLPSSHFLPYFLLRSYLFWELTLKIVQAKELATAAGKYPDTIPGIEKSTICTDLSYTYRVLDNGKRMSIHLSELENIIPPDYEGLLLTYETKHPIRGPKP